MNIKNEISNLIGNTPLMQLSNYSEKYGLKVPVIGKLEYLNPTGSIKDRAAYEMIQNAMDSGIVNKDTVIIEPTSGNTGIGLAAMGAAMGLKVIITMPETMSRERRDMIKAHGAEIILTDGVKGMDGAIDKAKELLGEVKNSYMPGQFVNMANVQAHYKTTGPEIWKDTEGTVDYLIAGIGTGGTISGTGKYLKERNPDIKIIGIEPSDSPVISGGKPGKHALQGIGAGFIPLILDTAVIDEIITVTKEDAYDTVKELSRTEGLMLGITSGAAIWGARKIAQRKENEHKTLVAILPDSGNRYISTGIFE